MAALPCCTCSAKSIDLCCKSQQHCLCCVEACALPTDDEGAPSSLRMRVCVTADGTLPPRSPAVPCTCATCGLACFPKFGCCLKYSEILKTADGPTVTKHPEKMDRA